MDIVVSSPGSPGTSFTDNVKEKIVIMYDVLESNDDFENARDFGTHLEPYGFNWNYTRNILPFLQNCGIVNYQSITTWVNKNIFTNIGRAYIDILKCIQVAKKEPESLERDAVIEKLKNIEEVIYFQCLVVMMKNKDCNYAEDFFDVLRFVDEYDHIDSTEYLLIQYEREQDHQDFMKRMATRLQQYRDGIISINVKTKTKNDAAGAAKSVNSFPYVHGNFTKAGVFQKGDSNQFFITDSRRPEVEAALEEVKPVWQS